MSAWDYRFVLVTDETTGETFVGLFEVYYDDAGLPVARTEDPTTIVGDTPSEAAAVLAAAFVSGTYRRILHDSEIGVQA